MTRQALVVSASRFINQGLMFISPVILARLLTVQDFGLYREFLLYTTLVGNLAAFSLANSLLYFVGLQPGAAWSYVRRIVIAVGATSLLAAVGFVALNYVLAEPLVAPDRLLPCVLYVLLYVNVDFWEFLWLARKKPLAVFAYTAGRLSGRIIVVVALGWLSRDVDVIIWSLVSFEAARFAISLIAWRRLAKREGSEPPRSTWREVLDFCIPSGLAVFVSTLNSSIGGIVIDNVAGEEALALFTIGGYVVMAIYPLRNSVSDVMLPELATLVGRGGKAWVPLWQRSVVLFAILLWPVALLLARFAAAFVETAFSSKYLAAVPVFQWYCVMIALSIADVALLLRALNRTSALLSSIFFILALNTVLLFWIVPEHGAVGAVWCLLASVTIGLVYLIVVVARVAEVSLDDLLPFARMGRVALALSLASVLIWPSFWTEDFGAYGAAAASAACLLAFVVALRLLRVEEATQFIDKLLVRLRRAQRTA